MNARRGSRPVKPKLVKNLFNAEWVARQIGIPVSKWPLNCYAVASAIVEAKLIPDARTCYGHYFGEVSPKSLFASRSNLAPRHGWVGLPGGWIYDPTRWVFTVSAHKPVLVHETTCTGDNDIPDYDLGGERFMQLHVDKRPPTDAEIDAMSGSLLAKPFELQIPRELQGLLRQLFGRCDRLKMGHIHYLATRGPRFLGELAAPVYQFLVNADLKYMIPIDFLTEVLGSEPAATNQVEQWKRRLAKIRDELQAISREINEFGGVTEDCKDLMDEVVELLSRRV